MAETLNQTKMLIESLRSLIAFFHHPVVVIGTFVLYFCGCMLYVVIACRRYERQQQPLATKNHAPGKVDGNVLSGERS